MPLLQLQSRSGDAGALQLNFKLKARINRSDARTVRQVLDQLAAKGFVRKAGDEFIVEAEMEGAGARELNRTFLSALRKVEKRRTLRAEWTSSDNITERFFDYVLKKTVKG
jgi:repressor of nif and glnA expression